MGEAVLIDEGDLMLSGDTISTAAPTTDGRRHYEDGTGAPHQRTTISGSVADGSGRRDL